MWNGGRHERARRSGPAHVGRHRRHRGRHPGRQPRPGRDRDRPGRLRPHRSARLPPGDQGVGRPLPRARLRAPPAGDADVGLRRADQQQDRRDHLGVHPRPVREAGMSTPTRPRRLRTWSALGELGRVPSDYEIVTHGLNYTFRPGRAAALESNPTAPMNMWFLTYRDKSPLQADDWDGFRDPDELTYRKYVTLQDEAETVAEKVL